MAVFKCKMCGASLEVTEDDSVIECKYCRTKQTLPKLDDDKRANLYDRANHFRRNNEFDKAEGIYENILNEDKTDAEAYWSIVLCRYGIEYVEDPATKKRVPTVNRAQYTSIFDDDNYKSAIKYARGGQKAVYEAEAEAINEIQKGILQISQNEEPFDVFICYKETDNNGRRTPDSVLANELYYGLKEEGFRVFFSRITLEDKLGTAYEPYIFAALNSAKVMVVLGTKPEYFNAVWVKNEWSRFLGLIKGGAKKTLIPAYKDMDPYDLPEEFSHLQAQDMSKLGFMQDLIRGIKKLASDEPKAKEKVIKETVVVNNGGQAAIAVPLKRARLALENGQWAEANKFCEQALNIDPECVEAYICKLCAEVHASQEDQLGNSSDALRKYVAYNNALRYAEEATADRLRGYNEQIEERLARKAEEMQERLAKESERREKLKVLMSKRNNIANDNQSLNSKRKAVENELQSANVGLNRFRAAVPKRRKFAFAAIISTLSIYASAALLVIMALVSHELIAPFGVLLLASFIASVVCFAIVIGEGTPSGEHFVGGFFAIYFTVGIIGLVIPIRELKKIEKGETFTPIIEECTVKIKQLDGEIEINNRQLKEIESQIAKLNK